MRTNKKTRKTREQSTAVDVVCLWVDGSDDAWRSELQTYLKEERRLYPQIHIYHSENREPEKKEVSARDELYYSAHGIVKFMPWVRKYFLVTMRPQKPFWWPECGRMGNIEFVLVHHDEIFEDKSQLPTFSSNAIQQYLHRIPGLAERFILFDDDCYIGQPMRKTDFFTKNGTPVVCMIKHVPETDNPDTNWMAMCMNTCGLIQSIIGKDKDVYFPFHVCLPLLKSSLETFYENQTIKRRSKAFRRFRSSVDFTVQYVIAGSLYGMGMLEDMPERVTTRFFGPDSTMSGSAPHLFCINHKLTPGNIEYMDALVKGTNA